jgi:dihydrofolate reductase
MINALFAVDHYGGMGFQGTLPWPHNADDLRNFKQLTNGHVVVMGSRSWLDPKMPKPLHGRIVYVASNRRVQHAGRISGDIVEEVLRLEKQHPTQTIWIVGGPRLIESCAGILDNIYLTHFKGSYKIDTKIDLRSLLTGFIPVRAEVSQDFQSTFIKYAPIFKRSTTSP